MRILLFMISLMLSGCLFSQSAKRIDDQIKKLNNSQFLIDHDKKATFRMNSSAALKLIKMGTKATDRLILALDDDSRNIMAHLVLCHIWYKRATFAGPKTGEEDISLYFLGDESGEGVVLNEQKSGTGYHLYISRRELEKIKDFWKNKTSK